MKCVLLTCGYPFTNESWSGSMSSNMVVQVFANFKIKIERC